MTKIETLRYYSEDSKVTMRNVALGARWAAGLVMLFSVLDFLIYPDYAEVFLRLRILCCIIVLSLSYLTRYKWARRKYRLFATLVQLTVALFLAIIIYLLNEPGTTYYAGLNLCIVGSGTVVQLTSRETMVASLIIFAMFLIASLVRVAPSNSTSDLGASSVLHEDEQQGNPHNANVAGRYEVLKIIGGDCLFIVSTIVLVVVLAFNQNNYRSGEFLARTRLRKNQVTLQEKNQALVATMASLHETEKQLFQSEKMSLLGELCAGVIHEIANPLNFTNHALFIAKKRLAAGNQDISEIVDDIQEGLDRIRDTISELREFSHTGSEAGETILIDDVIRSSLRLLNKPIQESKVTIDYNNNPELKFLGVKNQITQVFSNLILNAIQAMSSNPEIEPQLQILAKQAPEGQIEVALKDNGTGIAKEALNHLFDPFFTTKDPGVGTGLGLSICFRIIEAHGGKIKVDSEENVGSTFTVELPSAHKT